MSTLIAFELLFINLLDLVKNKFMLNKSTDTYLLRLTLRLWVDWLIVACR